MKILVIESSPHKHGSSNLLAAEFRRGAEEAGHDVTVFDAGHTKLNPCLGCGACGMSGPCVQKDDMTLIYPAYCEADVVVFASPMYYWGFSGQLKCTLDRLFAITELDPEWRTPHKGAVLLMAAEGTGKENDAPVLNYYKSLLGFLGWDDFGAIIAGGFLKAGAISGSPFMQEAFELGKSIC